MSQSCSGTQWKTKTYAPQPETECSLREAWVKNRNEREASLNRFCIFKNVYQKYQGGKKPQLFVILNSEVASLCYHKSISTHSLSQVGNLCHWVTFFQSLLWFFTLFLPPVPHPCAAPLSLEHQGSNVFWVPSPTSSPFRMGTDMMGVGRPFLYLFWGGGWEIKGLYANVTDKLSPTSTLLINLPILDAQYQQPERLKEPQVHPHQLILLQRLPPLLLPPTSLLA